MSVTFAPSLPDGRHLIRCACEIATFDDGSTAELGSCPACLASLNVNERNGRDLLEYLGLAFGPGYGVIGGATLAALCRRRLEMVEAEAAIPAVQTGRVFEGGREATRLREYAEKLLVIARLSGPQCVAWS